ncbi:MAG TPA: NAD-dependent epimerase/dehydratase family protein [Steroidobacteraceae bacterium]|nr:NAD-dependent epimerase/dehydratase family protein [Steroidobacteraceae bacterium]
MQAENNGKVALVAGASGLTGMALVRALLDSPRYARVIALSRRPLPFEHPKFANRILRFEELETRLGNLRCHEAFCCLGTTIKQAGSQQEFRAVDQQLAVRFARVARSLGADTLVHISSVGADSAARSFYLQVKGDTEKLIEQVRFPALHLMQPSLLLGSRREMRPLEFAAQLVMPLLNPLLRGELARFRAIPARDLARAMLAAAASQRRGVYRYNGMKLLAMGAAAGSSAAKLMSTAQR